MIDAVEIINLDPAMEDELEKIELACFPMANPDDLLSADDIRAYASTFPEGYFVAMVDGRPVTFGPTPPPSPRGTSWRWSMVVRSGWEQASQRRMEAVWGVPGEHPWEAFQL